MTACVGKVCFLFSVGLESSSLAFFPFPQSRERSSAYCIEKPTLDIRKKFLDISFSWPLILHKGGPLFALDG